MGILSDRRILMASAAVITAAIFAFLLATYPTWRKVWHGSVAGLNHQPVEVAAAPVAPSSKTEVATAAGKLDAGVPVPNTVSAPGEHPRTPKGVVPTFDVVRVEPSGDSVIAARAAPGAEIILLDQGKPIARATSDASGQVAFVPPVLPPGEHSLMLSVGDPDKPGSLSSESVAVSIPEKAAATPLVAVIQPDQPAKIISGDVAGSGSPSQASSGEKTAETAVAIQSIEAEDLGSFYATGKARPGSQCRIYLNGSFIATVNTGHDGSWSLKIKKGMRPGRYTVRADQVDGTSGAVQARAEVPFDYPDRANAGVALLRPKVAQKSAASAPAALASLAGLDTKSSSTTLMTAKMPASASAGPSKLPASLSVKSDADAQFKAVAGAHQPLAGTVQASTALDDGTSDVSPTVITQLLTARVARGDTLWRISRKVLGYGVRYTQIYAANVQQIRDPHLIYPGQIFVMPQIGRP